MNIRFFLIPKFSLFYNFFYIYKHSTALFAKTNVNRGLAYSNIIISYVIQINRINIRSFFFLKGNI